MVILMAIGAAIIGSMGVSKTAGSAVFGATVYGTKRKKDELEREQRLGLSSERDRFEDAKSKKIGIPGQKTWNEFTLLKENMLPEQHWACGEYYLTEDEMFTLFDGLRHDALSRGIGEEAELIRKSIKDGVKYWTLSDVWEGWEANFAWLKELSDRRLRDPRFRMEQGLPPLRPSKN